jgi:TolB protein
MAPTLRVFASSLLLISSLTAVPAIGQKKQTVQGIFEGSEDIGHAQPGTTRYDPATATYEIRGGGYDVWAAADDFRFTWTRTSSHDASLSADVHVDAPVTYRLSKGMLMFRQSLDPGSPYADIAIHADGHITLQYRLVQGGETKDVTLPENNVKHLTVVRHGDTFTAYAQGDTGGRTASPPSITVPMHGPVYVGLGVCSHNTDALQTVTFSNVVLKGGPR